MSTAGQPVPADRDHLDVNVIVCAYTEQCWDQTRAALASVLSQHPRPAQVLLVVDHDVGLTARAHRELPAAIVAAATAGYLTGRPRLAARDCTRRPRCAAEDVPTCVIPAAAV